MSDNPEQPWPDEENVETTVQGYQQGAYYPPMPQTPDQFARLLVNPDERPELQSAPPPELLNPHLFGPQGRI